MPARASPTHRLLVDLAPDSLLPSGRGGSGRSHAEDWGIYARFTPYNSIAGRSRMRCLDHCTRHYFGGVRLDASFGYSVKGANDSVITFIDEAQSDPLPHWENTGWALHAATGFPRLGDGDASRWIARTFAPLIEWGFVSDHGLRSTAHRGRRVEPVDSHGWELQLAHIWTIRRGAYRDPVGTVIGTTNGWSLAIPLAGAGEVRFDHATVPQSRFLTENNSVIRTGVSVILHPLRAWRWMR